MPQESEALLGCIKRWKCNVLGSFRGAQFHLQDRNCILVTSGMGLERAKSATRTLLAEVNPHFVISFGIAGAVHSDLHIGDVVVSGNTCLLNNGLAGRLQPLASLSEAAWKAVSRELQPEGAHLVAGTAITTRGSQVVKQRLDELVHPILEMETAGIAQVASGMGIPLLSIRSISDGPQSPIPFNLEAILDENDNFRLGRLLMMILRRPRIIFQYRQMLQNSRIAADNAAKAVVAALSQPSPVITPLNWW